jgi:hypothetical protein
MTPLPGLDPLAAHVHRKAVSVLGTRLQKGEPVHQATAATSGRREGILAATDRRILFVTAGLWGGKVQHFTYPELRRLQVERSVDDASLTLEFAGRSIRFTGLKKAAADEIGETVRKLTRRYPQKSMEQLRLERMVRMVEGGVMTQAEFEWDAIGMLGPPGAVRPR